MVQGVSAATARRAMDTMPPGYLETPGLYSTNGLQSDRVDISAKPKKKRTFIGTLAKLVVTAGVLAGGLVLAKNNHLIKKVKDPQNLWDKTQNKLSITAQYIKKGYRTSKAWVVTKLSKKNATQL